jgi:serine/threonine protein kinase
MIGALDLLDGLLTLNPKHRLSASAALHQLYFKAEPRAAKPEECDTRRKHSHSPPFGLSTTTSTPAVKRWPYGRLTERAFFCGRCPKYETHLHEFHAKKKRKELAGADAAGGK